MEYQHKQEAAEVAAQAAATAGQKETWMDEVQQEQFRQICSMIDTIKSGRDFYRVMNRINYGGYSVDVINAAREFKQCFNSAQYEPEAPSAGTLVAVAADMMERDTAANVEPKPIALAYTDDLGVARCGNCGAELLCNETGDMPDACPECGRRLAGAETRTALTGAGPEKKEVKRIWLRKVCRRPKRDRAGRDHGG